MKNYLQIIIKILIINISFAFTQVQFKDRIKSDEPIVVAHRALWRFAPENSLEAINLAIKNKIDMIEIDVRLTKDSVLILMHDESIDRTTSGVGLVADLTYDQISNYHLINGLGRVTKFKVPTLRSILLESKSKILINIDKADKYLEQVYDLLIETGTLDQVLLKGWYSYDDFIIKYHKIASKINYMPILKLDDNSSVNSIKNDIKNFKCDIIEIIFDTDQLSMLDSLDYIEKKIWVNSLWPSLCGGHDDDKSLDDPEANWGWLLDKGVDVIQSDRPLFLSKFIRNRQN